MPTRKKSMVFNDKTRNNFEPVLKAFLDQMSARTAAVRVGLNRKTVDARFAQLRERLARLSLAERRGRCPSVVDLDKYFLEFTRKVSVIDGSVEMEVKKNDGFVKASVVDKLKYIQPEMRKTGGARTQGKPESSGERVVRLQGVWVTRVYSSHPILDGDGLESRFLGALQASIRQSKKILATDLFFLVKEFEFRFNHEGEDLFRLLKSHLTMFPLNDPKLERIPYNGSEPSYKKGDRRVQNGTSTPSEKGRTRSLESSPGPMALGRNGWGRPLTDEEKKIQEWIKKASQELNAEEPAKARRRLIGPSGSASP